MMTNVGALLADLRRSRRMTQLDLAVLAEVSSRHVSFIENSRTRPSRDMLLRLADVLELPLRERNLLLTAGGYAVLYSEQHLESNAMQPVRDALDLMLENHNPFPAIVLDGGWNIVLVNQAQRWLSSQLVGDFPVDAPPNLLRLLFAPHGMRPHIENWDEVASFLLRRLKRQVLTFGKDMHRQLFSELLSAQPPMHWEQMKPVESELPMVTVNIKVESGTLRLFSTLSQFGTALDVGMEELLIESYFPADEFTRMFFKEATPAL